MLKKIIELFNIPICQRVIGAGDCHWPIRADDHLVGRNESR